MDENQKDQSTVNSEEQVESSVSKLTEQDKASGLAIASMVLGIVGLIFSCCGGFFALPFAIAAVIMAIVEMKKLNAASKTAGKGMAIAGLVTGIIGIVFGAISLIFLLAIGTSGIQDMIEQYGTYY